MRGSYPGLFARQLHCKASSPPGESGPRIWAGEAVFQMHVTMNFGGAGAVILSCPLWGTTLLASRVLFALTSFPCCLLRLMLVTHSPFQREVFLVRRGDERYIVNNFLPFLAPAPFPSVQDWAPAIGLEYRVVIHLHRKGREKHLTYFTGPQVRRVYHFLFVKAWKGLRTWTLQKFPYSNFSFTAN